MTVMSREVDEDGRCICPCHFKGDPGEGYSYVWDDDRDIRHEDWVTCRCGCPEKQFDERHLYRPTPRVRPEWD